MLLAEDPTLSESEGASELLDLIISESGDLARMIEDLLTTARLDAGALHYNFEDIEISEEVFEVVEPMTRSGAKISIHCDPGLVRADRLFQRFVHQGSATSLTGSVGLGLSSVQALLRGMGGSIAHARTEGKTIFTVRLPLALDLKTHHPFERPSLTHPSEEQSAAMASLSSNEELPTESPAQKRG